MSRLDSAILRLQAQRACLNFAIERVEPLSGPFIELGLGNGRTYDHLRELAPNREIFVFERWPQPHPDCRPDDRYLIVGDIEETLPLIYEWPECPVFIHSDIGTGDADRNSRVAAMLSGALPSILAANGLIASDQELRSPELRPISPPAEVPIGRYHMYLRIV